MYVHVTQNVQKMTLLVSKKCTTIQYFNAKSRPLELDQLFRPNDCQRHTTNFNDFTLTLLAFASLLGRKDCSRQVLTIYFKFWFPYMHNVSQMVKNGLLESKNVPRSQILTPTAVPRHWSNLFDPSDCQTHTSEANIDDSTWMCWLFWQFRAKNGQKRPLWKQKNGYIVQFWHRPSTFDDF